MERIKEAVEIAKAARGRLGDEAPHELRTPRGDSFRKSIGRFASGDEVLTQLDPKHLKATRIIADDVADPRSRSFEMLRTQVLRKMNEAKHHVLGITSPTPGCGKTVCALNLAISIARLPEKSITLLDFDLRKPHVAEYLGLSPGPGLDDVLRGSVPLEDIMCVPEIGGGRLRVFPTFHGNRDAAGQIASLKLMELMQTLRSQDPTGVILFDLPPVLAVDDVISFLPHLDSVLLVIASGQTTVSDIMNSERLLGGADILGMVLNKSEEKPEVGYSY